MIVLCPAYRAQSHLLKSSANLFFLLEVEAPPVNDPTNFVALSAKFPQLSLIFSVMFCITDSMLISCHYCIERNMFI